MVFLAIYRIYIYIYILGLSHDLIVPLSKAVCFPSVWAHSSTTIIFFLCPVQRHDGRSTSIPRGAVEEASLW